MFFVLFLFFFFERIQASFYQRGQSSLSLLWKTRCTVKTSVRRKWSGFALHTLKRTLIKSNQYVKETKNNKKKEIGKKHSFQLVKNEMVFCFSVSVLCVVVLHMEWKGACSLLWILFYLIFMS